ncbi:MAG: hypothetical protein JXO72_01515 [Vicinamibacteria bacterium]|nr:hypothetical protein [Vicinamibacteria bacterium]
MIARALFWMGLILAASAIAAPAQPFAQQDQDEQWSVSLNGEWKFKFGITEADFILPDYDDSSWSKIRVPGNWELAGFGQLHFGRPGVGVGLYRRSFAVPRQWANRRIILRFEGVSWGFEFWLNGQRAGSHEIPCCRSEFDVTSFLQHDGRNTLAVRVYRQYRGLELDTHDVWALSGIFRDVLLLSAPDPCIADATTTTEVTPDGARARVQLSVLVRRGADRGAVRGEISGTLHDSAGGTVASAAQSFALIRDDNARVALDAEVAAPKLWSAETPDLYEWRIALNLAGSTTHSVRRIVGIRRVSVENGVLRLNHRPIKIRGVNYDDIHPDVGRAMREEHYIRDVELMKRGNINAVRFSHAPPHPVFLDLCDRHGLYVIDAVPFGKGADLLRDPGFRDAVMARAEAIVERDKDHPSVIAWGVGDESPATPIVLATVERIRSLDPTRPRLLPGAGKSDGSYDANLSASADILAPHDPDALPAPGRKRWTLAEAAADARVTRPILVTAFNRALGTALEGLASRWELMQQHDRLAGGCIWHFQDRGLRRNLAGRAIHLSVDDRLALAESSPDVSVDVLLSMNDALDSRGAAGSDGLVYADRIPQDDYWLARKVFSPIVIPESSITTRSGRQTLSIPIQNRHDFTNLDQIRGEWRILQEGRVHSRAPLSVALPPRQQGTIRLSVDVPAELDRRDHLLLLSFIDNAGRPIYEHSIRLLPESQRVDFAVRLATAETLPVRSRRAGDMEEISVGNLEVMVHPRSNLTVRVGRMDLWFAGPLLRAGREPEMAEILQYRKAGLRYWENPLIERAIVRSQETEKTRDGGRRIRLMLEFHRSNEQQQGQRVQADVVCEVLPRGWLDVSYELRPIDAQDSFLDLGLGFLLPHSLTHLVWLGDGPYCSYPGQGEAAERGIHHICLMPDTETLGRFFSGNRSRVDLAAVTDAQGNGFGFLFEGSTIRLSQAPNGMVLSQSLRVAGKGGMPADMLTRFPLPASAVQSERGSMRIVPLEAGRWPRLFQEALGEAFSKPAWSEIAAAVGRK